VLVQPVPGGLLRKADGEQTNCKVHISLAVAISASGRVNGLSPPAAKSVFSVWLYCTSTQKLWSYYSTGQQPGTGNAQPPIKIVGHAGKRFKVL
jgi:hypothetical protein